MGSRPPPPTLVAQRIASFEHGPRWVSSNLSEKLMALADTGITTQDELCKRALKGLPRRHAA